MVVDVPEWKNTTVEEVLTELELEDWIELFEKEQVHVPLLIKPAARMVRPHYVIIVAHYCSCLISKMGITRVD